jgi:hypothetical protein
MQSAEMPAFVARIDRRVDESDFTPLDSENVSRILTYGFFAYFAFPFENERHSCVLLAARRRNRRAFCPSGLATALLRRRLGT